MPLTEAEELELLELEEAEASGGMPVIDQIEDRGNGFVSRVSQDYKKRIGEMEKSAQAYVSGEQSKPETYFQMGGQALNFGLNDVVGQGIVSAARSLPSPVKKVASDVYTGIKNTPVLGDALGGVGYVLGEAAEGYDKFKQNYPRAGRNADALLGYGSALAATLPVKGQSVPSQAVVAGQKTAVAAGKTAKAAGSVVDDLYKAKLAKYSPDISTDTIRKMGGKSIGTAEKAGVVIKPEAASNFIDDITQSIRPKTKWGAAAVKRDQADDIIDNLLELKGQPMGLDGAMELESTLGKLAYSAENFKEGKFSAAGLKIKKIQDSLSNMIENAADSGLIDGDPNAIAQWREGQKQWAASVRARELENIIENAQNFDHPATAIRVGMRGIIKNKNKFNKYSKTEKDLIRMAAKTGIVTDLYRLGASGLGPIAGGVVGGTMGFVSGGPLGAVAGTAAAGGASYAGREMSKAIATSRQMARANKAYETVAAKSIGLPTEKLTLKEIMKLPPEQAKMYLKNLPVKEQEKLLSRKP